ncbi:MAG: hypothetical protein V3S04_05935, partial [Candidatus Omnitrophota bacterium]
MARYVYFGESIETRVGPQEQKYGFSQAAPFSLKLYLKGKSELKHSDILKERAVWVGFIALFGVATDNADVLLSTLDELFKRKKPKTIED